jgi:hypothetical protein
MSEPTFRDIIDRWPSTVDFARDIGAQVEATRKWRQRNRIPSEWWASVIAASNARGLQITPHDLIAVAARRSVATAVDAAE